MKQSATARRGDLVVPGKIYAKDFVIPRGAAKRALMAALGPRKGQQVLRSINGEQVIRDSVLSHLAANRSGALTMLRAKLRALYMRRYRLASDGRLSWSAVFVTADDARTILAKAGRTNPKYRFTNHNFLGALFRTSGWRTDGSTILSTTAGSHANRLLQWRWVGA